MAYSELRVINRALQILGVTKITTSDYDGGAGEDWTDATLEQAVAANAVWEEIRAEVFEAADWRFAKTRTTLSKVPPRVDLNCGAHKHLYIVADKWLEDTLDISIEIYTNSSDALSVAEDSGDSQNIQIALADSTDTKNTAALIQTALRALTTVNGVSVASWTVTANTEYAASPPTNGVDLDEVNMAAAPIESFSYAYTLPSDLLRIASEDLYDKAVDHTIGYSTIFDRWGRLIVRNGLYNYVIETLPDKTKVLLTDYNASQDYPMELVYIRLETDPTYWTAHFITAVSYRLAAELASPLTQGRFTFLDMIKLYDLALTRAVAHNQSFGYLKDEIGAKDVEYAGR